MIQRSGSEQSAPKKPIERSNNNGTVVLFGEVLADIFPDRTVLGGAPFNVARHLKAFRLNPVLITRLGSDALRDQVLHVMSQNDMETIGVQNDDTHPTGQVQVHIEGGGHRFEILPMQAYDFIQPAEAHKVIGSVHPELIYYGTLAQRHEISRQALTPLLDSSATAKFLDINLRSPWYDERTIRESLQYANIVKLNDDELRILAEMFELSGSSPDDHAINLMNRFDIDQAVITCGAAGAWQINRDEKKTEVDVMNKITKVIDTVGAGDGFASVFILGSLKLWPAVKTLERAIAFAGAICEIRGAIPDHEDFYKPFTREWAV
jgi:fructokinase